MAEDGRLIKVGRLGVMYRGACIPASFFRHLQPGKRFVVLAGEELNLMHVRAADLEQLRRAYREYRAEKPGNGRSRKAKRRAKKTLSQSP